MTPFCHANKVPILMIKSVRQRPIAKNARAILGLVIRFGVLLAMRALLLLTVTLIGVEDAALARKATGGSLWLQESMEAVHKVVSHITRKVDLAPWKPLRSSVAGGDEGAQHRTSSIPSHGWIGASEPPVRANRPCSFFPRRWADSQDAGRRLLVPCPNSVFPLLPRGQLSGRHAPPPGGESHGPTTGSGERDVCVRVCLQLFMEQEAESRRHRASARQRDIPMTADIGESAATVPALSAEDRHFHVLDGAQLLHASSSSLTHHPSPTQCCR